MDLLEARLRGALSVAMKSRDQVSLSAVRSALGAIDNARSVDVAAGPREVGTGAVAGGVAGLGAGDVTRRELREDQIVQIVRAEVAAREEAAAVYERLGRSETVQRLRSESAVLVRLLAGDAAG